MRRQQSGFTLIELLIVISIIGLLAAVLLPEIVGSRVAANIFADTQNLRRHYGWIESYKTKHKSYPSGAGHKFVLATWASVVEHTEENFDAYFTPGLRDGDTNWSDLRKKVQKGEDPWPELNGTSSIDTHYAGRSAADRRNLVSGTEAWMANDNEGGWSFPDGTVNILFGGGQPTTYSYPQLQENYGLGKFDKEHAIETTGPGSPIPACQKLEK